MDPIISWLNLQNSVLVKSLQLIREKYTQHQSEKENTKKIRHVTAAPSDWEWQARALCHFLVCVCVYTIQKLPHKPMAMTFIILFSFSFSHSLIHSLALLLSHSLSITAFSQPSHQLYFKKMTFQPNKRHRKCTQCVYACIWIEKQFIYKYTPIIRGSVYNTQNTIRLHNMCSLMHLINLINLYRKQIFQNINERSFLRKKNKHHQKENANLVGIWCVHMMHTQHITSTMHCFPFHSWMLWLKSAHVA